jgi:hypothetical protein
LGKIDFFIDMVFDKQKGYVPMKTIWWLILIVLAGLLGVLFVQYLSVHPLQMSYYLFAFCVGLFAWLTVLRTGFQRGSLALAVFVSLGVFVAGHLSMTKIILTRDDPRPVPELTRKPGDPGLGHTAVIYFTHGEPETYNPSIFSKKRGNVPKVSSKAWLSRSNLRDGVPCPRKIEMILTRSDG